MAKTKYDCTELNARQQATYLLILGNSLKGLLTTQEDIIENYKYENPTRIDGYVFKDYGEHNNDHCRQVWTDIQFINNCDIIDKQIIIDDFTYRCATKEEGLEYAEKLKIKALGVLARAWNIEKKIKMNGQAELLFDDEEELKVKFIESVIADFNKEDDND